MKSPRNYEFRGFVIPDHMVDGLTRWIEHGIQPGHFLTAVLTNNLREAIARADEKNMANLPAFVGFLYNEAPGPCWGSPEKVEAWADAHEARRAAERDERSNEA